MSREGALWIGGLESYMDEAFIMAALQASGEGNGLTSIKVIKNKYTGEPATYGFINYVSDHNALLALHRLNGKIVPNTNPPIKYKLNHNSTKLGPGERDFSVWVGDLSPDVDDLELYKFFSARYQSVRTCKVVMDATGYPKGYGFVRFLDEREQQSALANMQGASGLGAKPIKVSNAIPKGPRAEGGGGYGRAPASHHAAASAADPYGQYAAQYSQYAAQWSQYAAWNQYYEQQQQHQSYYAQTPATAAAVAQPPPASAVPPASYGSGNGSPEGGGDDRSEPKRRRRASQDSDSAESLFEDNNIFRGKDSDLVDHSPRLDYEKMNMRFLKRGEELWNSMEKSWWWQDRQTKTSEDKIGS